MLFLSIAQADLLNIKKFIIFLNSRTSLKIMQVVVLCGGKGTRLNEYTEQIPKPLIEVGGKPVLSHIMDLYGYYGHKDFILCLGYKGEKIKEFFENEDSYNIRFVNTGIDSNKAERIMKIKNHINNDNFFVTYGDDLSNVDLDALLEFHHKNKKIVTLTAVELISPFGIMEINKKCEVTRFKEKPKLNHLMNGGFYVFNQKIFDYIKKGYDLEKETFEELAKKKMIAAFYHKGFWKSMNTLKDVVELNDMFANGKMPWTGK